MGLVSSVQQHSEEVPQSAATPRCVDLLDPRSPSCLARTPLNVRISNVRPLNVWTIFLTWRSLLLTLVLPWLAAPQSPFRSALTMPKRIELLSRHCLLLWESLRWKLKRATKMQRFQISWILALRRKKSRRLPLHLSSKRAPWSLGRERPLVISPIHLPAPMQLPPPSSHLQAGARCPTLVKDAFLWILLGLFEHNAWWPQTILHPSFIHIWLVPSLKLNLLVPREVQADAHSCSHTKLFYLPFSCCITMPHVTACSVNALGSCPGWIKNLDATLSLALMRKRNDWKRQLHRLGLRSIVRSVSEQEARA